MAQETCYTCNGMGDFLETERRPSTTGGMFDEVQVRRPCPTCFGARTVWVPDPVTTVSNSNPETGHIISDPKPEKPKNTFEENVAGWILLGLWGAIGYIGVTTTNLEWYWPVGVGFVVAYGVYKLLLGRYQNLLKLIGKLVLVSLAGGIVMFIVYLSQNSG